MKPLEFKIEETYTKDVVTGYAIVFYYEDNTYSSYNISDKPKGLELNRHYPIMDLYGYPVKDDREGL